MDSSPLDLRDDSQTNPRGVDPEAVAISPTKTLNRIAGLPFGRRFVVRLYNRILMHFAPRHVVTTWFGSRIDCDVRDMIQATLIHLRTWEPNSSRVFTAAIRPGDLVVDVGANIGYFTLLFSRLVGPTGSVIAVEASASICDLLHINLDRNEVSNVRVVNAAVWSTGGAVTLFEAPATNIGMTTTRPTSKFQRRSVVRGIRFSELLSGEEKRRATFVKIDVEGAETPILEDILDALDSFSPDLCLAVEADPVSNPEWPSIFARLRSAGFRAYDLHNHYDWLRLVDDPFPAPTELAEVPQAGADILFTRKPLTF